MREVFVFKIGKWDCEKKEYQRIADGKAKFHQWGVDYEEFESGPGCYTTAIIEREDGTVESVLAENVQFIQPF